MGTWDIIEAVFVFVFVVAVCVLIAIYYDGDFDEWLISNGYRSSLESRYGGAAAPSDAPFRYWIDESDAYPDFKQTAHTVLRNSGWREKYSGMQEVSDPSLADVHIHIKSNAELIRDGLITHKPEFDELGKPIYFSYTFYKQRPQKIYINGDNWGGVRRSGLSPKDYRTYVLEHEIGHALGNDHIECNPKTVVNGTCPVMYQSTRGHKKYKCGVRPSTSDFTLCKAIS